MLVYNVYCNCLSMYTAGYNHLDVVDYLLEHGADVTARDKGGLIPLHNASSYGVCTLYIVRGGRSMLCDVCTLLVQHVDVALSLIKFNSQVNTCDRWNFTPLHEAAQKGRTQLCSLLVSLQTTTTTTTINKLKL